MLLLTCFAVNAQQNNNWYFGGRAGLNFNASGAQSIPSLLTNSVMVADEAAAAISDENGDLLFYTNGIEVYNRLHQVMPNGNNLKGNISACQIAIVAQPGNDSLFYIFTTGATESGYTEGYNYSIVNMKRDNGKGDVVVKNVLLTASCTERLTTARHANGIDVWVITNDNNSNVFRAWLVNCSGLQLSAVVSTTGIVMDQHHDMNSGVMKVSPDGKMFCQVHFPYFDIIPQPNFIQLFDFNNSTGIISNPRSVGLPDAGYTHCEFSPNSQLLYLTRPYQKKIDQLQITLPSVAAIQSSRVSFATNDAHYDIQLAPDEKIYISRPGQSLTVIHQPNVSGTGCNLVLNDIDLAPGGSFLGLPSHINDIVFANDPNNGFSYTILDSCSGTVQFNAFSAMGGTVTWDWDFGDGNISSSQNPIHVFTPSGNFYTIKLRIGSSVSCGAVFRSARIKPSGIITGQLDFDFIVRCDSGYVRFINKTPGLSTITGTLTWDFGDGNTSTATNPIHTYALPGNYTVKLKLTTGTACLDEEKSLPVEIKNFTVVAPPDQTILVGQSVFLSTASPGTSYQWSPGIWLNDSTIRNPIATPMDDISYTVTAYRGDGCVGKDSVRIHVLQYNDIYVPSAFTPNNDGKNDDIKPFFPGNYQLKEFSIFDRWGNKLFTTSQRGAGWDGKIKGVAQGTGVYVWIVSVIDAHTGLKIERKGTFAIIK
ncbi:MAG: PKD domain-containing protein [Chitinophagaceae bacterium]|nr:PKD domain-containing protein [Chitinophagaceae bacterium]